MPITSSACLAIVLSDTHSWSSKVPAQTQFCACHNGHHSFLQVLLHFRVEYLSSCQHLFGVDPHACGKFWSHRLIFILPSTDLVHNRHCIGEYSFRLNICMPETRVAAEWPVIHKDFPEFPLCASFLDCLHILSRTFSIPFPLGVSCVRQALQLHILKQVPKTFLLEPPSFAPPWGLQPEHCPGALKVLRFNWSEMYQSKRGNSRSTGVYSGRRSGSVSVTTGMAPEHIAETLVPMSFCFHFTRPKVHRYPPLSGVRSGYSPIPTPSTPLQDSSPCLVHCSVARSVHAVNTFRAVWTPSKGTLNVISIAMLNVSLNFAAFVPLLANLRLSLDGAENHRSRHWSGQGASIS